MYLDRTTFAHAWSTYAVNRAVNSEGKSGARLKIGKCSWINVHLPVHASHLSISPPPGLPPHPLHLHPCMSLLPFCPGAPRTLKTFTSVTETQLISFKNKNDVIICSPTSSFQPLVTCFYLRNKKRRNPFFQCSSPFLMKPQWTGTRKPHENKK